MSVLEQSFDLQDTAEVHWSGKTVMAVFFAITLVSAVFFGLGYSFGRGISIGGGPTPAASTAAPEAAAAAPATHHAAAHSTVAARDAVVIHSAPPAGRAAAAVAKSHGHASPERYMVQVGAVTQRKDAQRLQATLSHHGFHAGIYAGEHGRLLHVQIGPLSSLSQAQAVRHRVQASGFHAILMHG